MNRLLIITFVIVCSFTMSAYAGLDPSYSERAVIDTVPFYKGGTYDTRIPKPNDFLEHPIGHWPLRYYELIPYLKEITSSSRRIKMETHGKSHEGRDLFNLIISSEENMKQIDDILKRMDEFADASSARSKKELEAMIDNLPATAWLGYSIHGDEISGVDAAAQLIYQLAAGTDELTMELLDNIVIIIDPIQNPDGRERYLSMLQTYKSHVPNYNRRAMQHSGVWPWGRSNHYLFDLNRDWILLTQPETIGKVATIQKWHPQLVVDAHEMGSSATFLFSPPREPVNYNIANNVMPWYKEFAKDQAAAFDERGWTYYTGEWNEQWYPGYGSAWPTFFGSIGILYEMAGVDGQFVKQPDDYLLTYHEAVNKQFTSSIANLTTLAKNKKAIMLDFFEARRHIYTEGEKTNLSFIIKPDSDRLKTKRFIDRLLGQGIEVQKAKDDFNVSSVVNTHGEILSSLQFPAGSYLISTAQENGALAKAILEFDPRLKNEFIKEERREKEKHGDTRMYETSAWSVTLAYDMDAYQTNSKISGSFENITETDSFTGQLYNPEASVGFVVNMEGEQTYRLLSRLFGKDLVVYASEKAFTIEGKNLSPGSLFIRNRGNRSGLPEILSELAEEVGINIHGVNSGASSEGSYLGAPTFRLLSKPKVALVAGNGISYTSCGTIWYTLDKELEYPHSLINLTSLSRTSLDQYNVIILPGSWGPMSSYLGRGGKAALEKWVNGGGTLICTGSAAHWAADSSSGMSQVKLMRQALDKLPKYLSAVERERNAENPKVDTTDLWSPKAESGKKDEKEGGKPKKLEKEQDEWNRRFSPAGVILNADLDREEWMTFSMNSTVPVLGWGSRVLLSKPPVKTVARFSDESNLRLSGLLWPEGRERVANSAYATRERKGSGQIILFSVDPNLRAYFYGTRKLLVNSILYGPGMGTSFEGPYNQERY